MNAPHRRARSPLFAAATWVVPALLLAAGCGSAEKKDRDFFTSGNREADQRAEQRVAKVEQLRGGDEGGDKQGDVKKPLYDRLGGEEGIKLIVGDFVSRALNDPRVNWDRTGVKSGGFLGFGGSSKQWTASPENIERMKKHIAQFIGLATGGPPTYEGKDMKASHAGMRISNAEFDASIGDLKATLDNLAVPTDEQKELLAIVESTRPQVVEER